MGIVLRQSIKTYFTVLGGSLLGAVTLWLSTKYLPKQELGFLNTLTRYALMLALITQFGVNSTVSVLIHRYANNDDKRKVFITICLFTPLVLLFAFTGVYFLLPAQVIHHFQPNDRPLMQQYYAWLPVYTLMFIYMTLVEQYLISQMKVAISSFIREVVLRVLTIILMLLFALGYVSFYTVIVGTILLYTVPVVAFFFLAVTNKNFGLSFKTDAFTRTEYKEMLSFSWYHYLLNLAMMFLGYMDIFLLPFYDHKGFSVVAVYSVAVYLISLLNMPSRSFLPASLAAFANAFAEKDTARVKDIFYRSSINILIATVGFGLIICCNLQNAVAVIGTHNDYAGLAPAFLILMLGNMVNIATGMNDMALSVTNYYKFNFYVSMSVCVLMFVLLRVLIPVYSIYGAAWATAISFILFNIIKFFFVWKKLDLQPFSRQTPLVLIAALPAFAGGYFFPHLFDTGRHIYVTVFADAAMRSTIIIVVYVLMLLWLKPSEDLRTYLASIKKNKRLF